jgi:hypothetical protein
VIGTQQGAALNTMTAQLLHTFEKIASYQRSAYVTHTAAAQAVATGGSQNSCLLVPSVTHERYAAAGLPCGYAATFFRYIFYMHTKKTLKKFS